MLLSVVVAAYGEALANSKLSRKTTQRNYYFHAKAFAEWLLERLHHQPRARDVSAPNLRAYLTEKEPVVTPGTLYQYDSMFRHFTRFLTAPGEGAEPYLLSDPMDRVARPSHVRGKRVLPSRRVIQALVSAPDKIFDPYRRVLAHAVLSVMMDCGLRPGEVRHCLLTDYDRAARTLTIRGAKGNKGRVLYLPTKTTDAINALVKVRPAGCHTPGLFAIDKGRSLGIEGLPKLLRELLHHAGHRPEEEGNVTPHALRHVAAKKLLKASANLRELQEIFGWASLEMAAQYIEIDEDELRDALERATQPPAPPEPALIINRPDLIREQAKRFRVDRKRVPR